MVWALAGIGFVLLAFLFYVWRRDHQSQSHVLNLQQRLDHLQNQLRLNLDGNTQLIQQQLGSLTKQLDDRLNQNLAHSTETHKMVHSRMDQAAKVFGELQNRLGQLNEANLKIFNVGKDIASLQEILRNPKARGNLGELLLANLLAELLPGDYFELQHSFKNNEKVDAVIKLGERMIPIDAKFPLENFRRLAETRDEKEKIQFKKLFTSDVRKHVDSISKKYILPEEGTFDFAFMYIPAENVFYEVVVADQAEEAIRLQEYALKKRIIPVSPNSFYAYLTALLHALRGERMQKNVTEIIAQIRHQTVEISRFREDFEKIGFHLNNLKGSYESSEKRLTRYQDRLTRIQEFESEEPKNQIKLIQ